MTTRRVRLLLAAVLVGVPLLYLLAWPVPIAPVAWEAPVDPGHTGAFARNDRLSALEPVPVGDGLHGPEAMTADPQGRLYAATAEGIIVRLAPDGSTPERWADTKGRPLGMAFDSAGTMYVADARRGLLAISPAGEVRVVAQEADGTPIRFADDLDVAADGRVYFSDASTKFHPPAHEALAASLLEILEHAGNGRLLRYDPGTGTTTTLLRGLVFANGVAMSHDQRSVLVNETGSYRVLRVWIDGPRAGESEPLIDALPGFPDNITRGAGGRYWVALAAPRDAAVDALAGRPFLRKVVQRLPTALRPAPRRYGHVIAIDDSGRVVADLQDPSGRLPMITSALEVPGALYLGSLVAPTAGRVAWTAAAPRTP